MDDILPDVSPSPELRERVLDAVTAAMVNQGAGELSVRQSRRVAPMWRTASIGLMTAVIVLGTAFVYVYETKHDSTVIAQSGGAIEDMLNFKGDFRKAAVDPLTARYFFRTRLYTLPANKDTVDGGSGVDESSLDECPLLLGSSQECRWQGVPAGGC